MKQLLEKAMPAPHSSAKRRSDVGKQWITHILIPGAIIAADQWCKSFFLSQGLIFANKRLGIYIPAILLIAFLLTLLKSKQSQIKLPLALIIAGGTSNLIDFIGRGAIIDYLHLKNFYFNLADIAILTGVLLIVIKKSPSEKNLRGDAAKVQTINES